jgi:nitronate monooxygenase
MELGNHGTLTSLLGVALPVVQAPMAGSQSSALAIAVAHAGGLGSLPCALLSAEAVRAEYATIRRATDRPINLNFFCHTPPAPCEAREQAWRASLAPFYRELGLDLDAIPAGPTRAPFDDDMATLVEQLRPQVVSFHFGLPREDLLRRVQHTGATVLSSATTLAEARWLEARGVDAVIAQGAEAGGHRGLFLHDDLSTQVGTLALVAQLCRALRVPVIAAGGIADRASTAAARALGAAGVQVGTAYLFCPEATVSPVHRAALRDADTHETALTNLFTGRPARGLLNRFLREHGPLSPLAPAFPLAAGAVAPLRAEAERRGSGDFSPLWCGQNAGACRERPAAALTLELASAFS